MKIKKKTSLMLIAASTAAVVGVAAVSFAAWTGNTRDLTASAATGNVSFYGFTTEDTLSLGTFVPYDQPSNTYDQTLGYITYYSEALPEYTVTQDYSITVETETSLSFYFKVTTEALTEAPEDLTGWTQATATAASLYTGTATKTTVLNKTDDTSKLYLNVVLASNSNADANQTNVSFTLKVVQAE